MIKIVVYNDTKTVVEEEIRGFANASMAANYRDHDDRLAYKTTVLEQDVREAVYSGNYGDTAMDSDGSEGIGEGEAQVMQYHGKAGHFWAGFRFYGLVILLGGGAFFSFACLIGSVLAGPR